MKKSPWNANSQYFSEQVCNEIRGRAATADRNGLLPVEDLECLHSSGLLTLPIPRELGGMGYSMVECLGPQLELSKANASTGLVTAMLFHTIAHACETNLWTDFLFEKICSSVVSQGSLLNTAASEPQLGSPSRGGKYQTIVLKSADQLVINGQKTWVTGGKHLTFLLVKLDYDGDVAVVLVENHLPGIHWEETWKNSLCLRGSESNDLILKDVSVPCQNILERGNKLSPVNVWFPIMTASVYLGSAMEARDCLIRFALERVPSALGKPIASLPGIQRKIGEMDVLLQASRALLFEVAAEWDANSSNREAFFTRAAAAKQFVVQAAQDVTQKSLEAAGASSILPDLSLERFFRDVRAGMMQPPSGDTAYEIVGRRRLLEAGYQS